MKVPRTHPDVPSANVALGDGVMWLDKSADVVLLEGVVVEIGLKNSNDLPFNFLVETLQRPGRKFRISPFETIDGTLVALFPNKKELALTDPYHLAQQYADANDFLIIRAPATNGDDPIYRFARLVNDELTIVCVTQTEVQVGQLEYDPGVGFTNADMEVEESTYNFSLGDEETYPEPDNFRMNSI